MKILTDLKLLKKESRPVILAAGFFDGVHRGHRKVIDRTIARAREVGGEAWALTFDAHPLTILRPESAPSLLTSNRHKLKLLGALDLDGCLLMPFTRELADLEPADFINRLRVCAPTLAEIVVGRNWQFGRKRKGDPILLSKLARKMNLKVTVVRPVLRKGEIISSTRIRVEIMAGNLKEAAVMLGRPFSVLGTVTRGKTLGRKLGFPTANLDPHNEVLPAFGVYAVHALVEESDFFDGVLNLGVRPTFGKGNNLKPTLELHLFDFDKELYGHDIEIFFVRKIRDERKFASQDELKKYIAGDVETASKLLGEIRTHVIW